MFRTVVVAVLLTIALTQGNGFCPPGQWWNPTSQSCEGTIQPQVPDPTASPSNSMGPMTVIGGPPDSSNLRDDFNRRSSNLLPLSMWSQDCRVNFYWNGRECIPYSQPNRCIDKWIFNWNDYTCKASADAEEIRCPQGRYFNGIKCMDWPRRGDPICIPAWTWNEFLGRCYKLPPGPENCPAGKSFNGLQCLNTVTQNDCKNGWTWYAPKSICTPPSATSKVCIGGYFNG